MVLLTRCLFLLAVAMVGWGLWRASRPQPVFVVRIVGGEPRTASGKVTSDFLRQVREVAAREGLIKGNVSGLAEGREIRLAFSRQFPTAARQQIRNWWGTRAWKAAGAKAIQRRA
jgi:hypothetical protein